MGELRENIIAAKVVDAAYRIHRDLGPGLLETVYQKVLSHELEQASLRVCREVPIGIQYGELSIEDAFRADLIVEDCLLVELKSVETLQPVHRKQVTTYLKLTQLRLGLLINFGSSLIKNGLERIVNNLPEDRGT